MILDIEIDSSRPIYQQIAMEIRGGIVSGSIDPGDRLPPGRELAAALGVNLETVQRAYRLLSDDGIVTSRVGRGTRIAEDIDPDRLRIDSLVGDLVEKAQSIGMTLETLTKTLSKQWKT